MPVPQLVNEETHVSDPLTPLSKCKECAFAAEFYKTHPLALQFSCKRALLIGIEDYKGEGGSHMAEEAKFMLRAPLKDVKLMEETLIKLGFQVTLITNVQERKSFLQHVDEYVESLKATKLVHGDKVLSVFMYSGHGFQVAGETYMRLGGIGSNEIDRMGAKEDWRDNHGRVGVQELSNKLQEGCDTNVLVLDCCRKIPGETLSDTMRMILVGVDEVLKPENPLEPADEGRWVQINGKGFYPRVLNLSGKTVILFAASPGKAAQERRIQRSQRMFGFASPPVSGSRSEVVAISSHEDQKHRSIFTGHLVEVLQNTQYKEIHELAREAASRVYDETKIAGDRQTQLAWCLSNLPLLSELYLDAPLINHCPDYMSGTENPPQGTRTIGQVLPLMLPSRL